MIVGGGPAIENKKLENMANLTKNLRKSLKSISEAISTNEIPNEAVINNLPGITVAKSMYTLIANISFIPELKRNRVFMKTNLRPYCK